jgi:hypothetical protein
MRSARHSIPAYSSITGGRVAKYIGTPSSINMLPPVFGGVSQLGPRNLSSEKSYAILLPKPTWRNDDANHQEYGSHEPEQRPAQEREEEDSDHRECCDSPP